MNSHIAPPPPTQIATWLSWAVGGFLFVAAILKLTGDAPSEVQLPVAFASLDLHRLTILVELLVAIWLLSGIRAALARGAALALFALFAALSLRMALQGQSSCGCFGRIVVHPWVTFSIDLVIAMLLFASLWMRSASVSATSHAFGALLLRGAAISAVLLLVLMAVWGSSFSTVLARLRGQTLAMDPQNIAISSGRAGDSQTIHYTVINYSDRSVKLIGGSSSCACATTDAMPCEIAPGGRIEIPVRVKYSGSPGLFKQSFYIYTDHPNQLKLTATFTGAVE